MPPAPLPTTPRPGIEAGVLQPGLGVKGFEVIFRRWAVERAFGRLVHHRRPARDGETHPHRCEAMFHGAVTDLVSRRLTRESTPNWRGSEAG